MTGHGRARRYAGYAEVEIGGTYDGRTAAAFRALANQYGLKPEGSHVPGGGATWRGNRGQVFADAAALGLRYVGIASPPDGTPRTHDGYRAMAEEFNTWGAEARAHGLRFYFHNHPEDFTLDGGTPIYDTLLEETDRRLVWFELDIAWIEAGGQSAFDYVRENPSRYPLFHKDIRWDAAGPRTTPANVRAAEPALLARRRGQGGHTRPGRAASTWRTWRCVAGASGRVGPGRRRRSSSAAGTRPRSRPPRWPPPRRPAGRARSSRRRRGSPPPAPARSPARSSRRW
jgi:sugar phosphate isomerase/epimerase